MGLFEKPHNEAERALDRIRAELRTLTPDERASLRRLLDEIEIEDGWEETVQ